MRGKYILFAVSAMGLGHVQRSLPLIRHLLATGNELLILSHGRALDLLRLELAEAAAVRFRSFPDYPPLQRGSGIAHYAYYLRDLLAIGACMRRERAFVERLARERRFDAMFSDGRFGVFLPDVPTFLVCHQIRILLPALLRPFQPVADLAQYLLLRKFTRVLVPDFADAGQCLAGRLAHNWMARAIEPLYLGYLSSLRAGEAAKCIDVLVIAGGFIEAERANFLAWARDRLRRVHGRVVLVLGDTRAQAAGYDGVGHEVHACVHGEARDALMRGARLIIGRAGYTTLMDLCQIRGRALLIPTPRMTEQGYLARRIARMWHGPGDVAGLDADGVYFDAASLPPALRDWSTQESVRVFAHYLDATLGA